MIIVSGQFRFPPARVADAREAMARVVTATRAEAGCLAYCYGEDVLDPGLIRVFEKWESRAALDAHFTTQHMADWKAEREAFGLTDRVITVCEGGEETAV